MQGKIIERCMQLAEAIAIEQDPEKMSALITEDNELLAEKERRLASMHATARTPDTPN